MGVDSLGGGAIIALAAVLWLVYLMPTWARRREYLATERNAVRLQQTLRILAETAEVPEEIRAETTARSVAEQHRALRLAAHRAEAEARSRDAAAARALGRRDVPAPREPKQRAAAVTVVATERLRRSRILATTVLGVSIVGAVFALQPLIAGGAWLPIVAASLGIFGSLAMLQRIATVAAARRASLAVDRTVSVAQPLQSFIDWEKSEPERPSWTPVPVPKPMYLSRREQRPAARAVAAQRSLLDAAAKAEEALRNVQSPPNVAPIVASGAGAAGSSAATARGSAASSSSSSSAAEAPAVSGYASMGVLGETSSAIVDLDAVLRRRRAG